MNGKHPIAMTVDVEDAINQAMRNIFNTDMKPTIRVVDNTLRLLDLFAEFNIKATFFIPGLKAGEDPTTVKNIKNAGHGIGSETLSETKSMEKLSQKELITDFCRANKVLETIMRYRYLH